MFWYQVNPDYFLQIVQKKKILKKTDGLSFFTLLKNSLNYIKRLGADGVWIMPLYIRGEVNKKGNGSPYSIKDFQIDTARFGSEKELKNLILAAHNLGLKIITEYVPNHLAPDAIWLQDNKDMAYTDDKGNFLYDQNWSDTVKLKHAEKGVRDFTRSNMIRIISDYGFDGFRLDMAHCPFYDVNGELNFKEFDMHFWQEVLQDDFFKNKKPILIGEVYADRNQAYNGYGDHIRLMRENIIVYDKSSHDHIAHCLKGEFTADQLASKYFQELNYQKEALKASEKESQGNNMFLRIPSNHDDSPGIANFGGEKEYLLGFSTLAFIGGHSMVYDGDEFGLKVKPSITGENKADENGILIESNEIQFIEDNSQKWMNSSIKSVIKIKTLIDKICEPESLISYNYTDTGKISQDIFIICRYSLSKKKIYLICINTSKSEGQKWARIDSFYNNKKWLEFLSEAFSRSKKKKYSVKNLLNNESYGIREASDPFWVGVNPLDIQILELS